MTRVQLIYRCNLYAFTDNVLAEQLQETDEVGLAVSSNAFYLR